MADEPSLEEMTRDELIGSLMWNEGGTGFGACAVATMFAWATDEPGSDKPDAIAFMERA